MDDKTKLSEISRDNLRLAGNPVCWEALEYIESLEAELRTLREDRKRCRCHVGSLDVADMYPED